MNKACREGDINMVKRLLNFGYSLEQCAQGPMFIALKCGHLDIITLFREIGVEIDLNVDGNGGAEKFNPIAEELNKEADEINLTDEGKKWLNDN